MKNVQSSISTMASASRLIAPVGAWGIAAPGLITDASSNTQHPL